MSTMGTRCAASPRSATSGPLQWLLLAEKTARPSACCTGLAENGLVSSGSPPLAIMTENQNVLGSTLEVLPSTSVGSGWGRQQMVLQLLRASVHLCLS